MYSVRYATRALCALALLILVAPSHAQESPNVEPVYGGRINAMAAYAPDANTTRLFIATESANSLFYGDLDHSAADPFDSFQFQTVPDFDADDGYGANIQHLAVDAGTGLLFLIHHGRLLQHDLDAGTTATLETENMMGVRAHDGYLLYLRHDASNMIHLHFGEVGTAGFTEDASSPTPLSGSSSGSLEGFHAGVGVNPVDSTVAAFVHNEVGETVLTFHFSNSTYASLGDDLTRTMLPYATGGYGYRAFGIAPDGRMFMGAVKDAEPHHTKFVAYSDNQGATWDTLDTGIVGTSGPNFAFAGDASAYHVYFGTAMSDGAGEAGTWMNLGHSGQETHPNDGSVLVDPSVSEIVYLTTDQGIGASEDQGATIFEIDEGVTAVQVNGFDMNAEKTIGWVASKSGIRRVRDYQGSSEAWELFYPNGDGSPYYAVAMDTTDATGNTAFVGNSRIYWTTDGGATWDRIHDEPAGFSFFTRISALALDYTAGNRLFATYFDDREDKAGIFVGEYDGSAWAFTQITSSTFPTDGADLWDVVVVDEGGASVAYAGAQYEHDATTGTARSIYRIEEDGSGGWTVSQDMLNSTQNISATIKDLYANADGDLYACGTDAGGTGANIYLKAAGTTEWTALTTSGVSGGDHCNALTVDEATGDLYIAIDTDLYVLTSSAAAWRLFYAYPVGTQINFLYYDDLLVGTGTGLYEHPAESIDTATEHPTAPPLPEAFSLAAAYPNPFNPTTTFSFSVREAMPVQLRVFDVLGREVATLYNDTAPAGTHTVRFGPEGLASGLYLYRLTTPYGVQTRSAVRVE